MVSLRTKVCKFRTISFEFKFLASRSSYLHDSSGSDLDNGVEVLLIIGKGGEKTVDVMIVVAGLGDVDDIRCELVDAA